MSRRTSKRPAWVILGDGCPHCFPKPTRSQRRSPRAEATRIEADGVKVEQPFLRGLYQQTLKKQVLNLMPSKVARRVLRANGWRKKDGEYKRRFSFGVRLRDLFALLRREASAHPILGKEVRS